MNRGRPGRNRGRLPGAIDFMGESLSQPLVYSCSGASSAAQMANHIAIRLDRLGVAEMSCIAGVGGDVGSLVRIARSGRPILVLDGCPLRCAARILDRQAIRSVWQFDLSRHGVEKRQHEDFDPDDAARVLKTILDELQRPGIGTPSDLLGSAGKGAGGSALEQSPTGAVMEG